MSLGYIPILISMLLESWGQTIAVFSGLLVSLLFMFTHTEYWTREFPNFILKVATFILLLAGVSILVPGDFIPDGDLPLTLELSLLLALMPVYLHRKRFLIYYVRLSRNHSSRLFAQSAESAVVSARIFLLLGSIHLLIVVIAVLLKCPLSEGMSWMLFTFSPPLVLLFTIVLNQISIDYFNYIMSHADYVPVVNRQGSITRIKPVDAMQNTKTSDIVPLVRIVVYVDGKMYLAKRPDQDGFESSKMDIPFESYWLYGESLEECCCRTLNHWFRNSDDLHPVFSIRYNFSSGLGNRQVYLFLLEIDDEARLTGCNFQNGKLWQFEQIEQNLNCNYFSSLFEGEYDYLKDVIDIREKYKES